MAQVYCERLRKKIMLLALALSAISGVVTAQDRTLEMADVSEPPVLLERAEPHYPTEARSKGVRSATVQLAIVITTQGRVTQARVLKPVGLGFDEEARNAVLRWRFRPAKKNGLAVAVRATVEVSFTLTGTDASTVV